MLLSLKLKNNFFPYEDYRFVPIVHLCYTWGSRQVVSKQMTFYKYLHILQLSVNMKIKTVTQIEREHTFITCYVARQICSTVINIKKTCLCIAVSVIFKKIDELLLYVKYRVSRNPKFRDVSYKEVGRKQNLDSFYISLVPIMENLLEYLMLFSLLFCLTKRCC